MNCPTDYALDTQYVDFGKDVLAKDLGNKTTVIMQEDTAYGAGTYEFIKGDILPTAGIKMVDHIDDAKPYRF
jgi:hypothetical protein